MKLVRHIEQFTRGEKPLKTLNIGKRVEIDNWFKIWIPHANYEISDNLNIFIEGNLDISFTIVISLPNNLHVDGWLNLGNTKITFLPDNLYIGKWLSLRNTKITFLPNNLHVGDWLQIRNTKITFLPDDLYVGGKIYKSF